MVKPVDSDFMRIEISFSCSKISSINVGGGKKKNRETFEILTRTHTICVTLFVPLNNIRLLPRKRGGGIPP